jgi:hypothetical protein
MKRNNQKKKKNTVIMKQTLFNSYQFKRGIGPPGAEVHKRNVAPCFGLTMKGLNGPIVFPLAHTRYVVSAVTE